MTTLGRTAFALAAVVLLVSAAAVFHYRGRLNFTRRECPDVHALARRTSGPEFDADEPTLFHPGVVDVKRLRYACDTRTFLRSLYEEVTRAARNEETRGLVWVAYIQRTIVHTCAPQQDSTGWALYHPIALLESRLLHCSQVARLIVDGFSAVGTPARVLQMNGHQSAEFFANGRWILAEGDILSNGQFLRDAAGRVTGIDKVATDPSILDSVRPYGESAPVCMGEFQAGQDVDISTPWIAIPKVSRQRSLHDPEHLWKRVFVGRVYPEWTPLTTPYVIKKTAPPEAANNHLYGWNFWTYCERSDPTCTN